MVSRPRKNKPQKNKRRNNKRKQSTGLALARRALKVATQVANASTETKYFSLQSLADLAGSGGFLSDAYNLELTNTAGYTPIFGTDHLHGNKAFLKYIKGTWDIHMDNVNNEEETVNFTVAVVKLRQDVDASLFLAAGAPALSSHVSSIQGQAYYDPRFFKVCYYKHFTLTMGGTSPGTAGECRRYGKFFIPVRKMIRFTRAAHVGDQNNTYPASAQDRYWFVVHTDNSSADTESPRMNARFMTVYRDSDTNV